jgi:hypothetical protein
MSGILEYLSVTLQSLSNPCALPSGHYDLKTKEKTHSATEVHCGNCLPRLKSTSPETKRTDQNLLSEPACALLS